MAERHDKVMIQVAPGKWIVRDSTRVEADVEESMERSLERVRERGAAARAHLRGRAA